MSTESPDAPRAARPSLGVLMDNARSEIVAGRCAGLEPRGLLVSARDFEEVARAKRREERNGYGPRLFGFDLIVAESVDVGDVRLDLP